MKGREWEGRGGKGRKGVDQKRLSSLHLEGHLTLQAHTKLIGQCELMFL